MTHERTRGHIIAANISFTGVCSSLRLTQHAAHAWDTGELRRHALGGRPCVGLGS